MRMTGQVSMLADWQESSPGPGRLVPHCRSAELNDAPSAGGGGTGRCYAAEGTCDAAETCAGEGHVWPLGDSGAAREAAVLGEAALLRLQGEACSVLALVSRFYSYVPGQSSCSIDDVLHTHLPPLLLPPVDTDGDPHDPAHPAHPAHPAQPAHGACSLHRSPPVRPDVQQVRGGAASGPDPGSRAVTST